MSTEDLRDRKLDEFKALVKEALSIDERHVKPMGPEYNCIILRDIGRMEKIAELTTKLAGEIEEMTDDPAEMELFMGCCTAFSSKMMTTSGRFSSLYYSRLEQ